MKIVINKQHGGYNLSPQVIKKYSELKGIPCYFFNSEYKNGKYIYTPVDIEKLTKDLYYFVEAYTVPNPVEFAGSQDNFYELKNEQREELNKRWDEISIDEKSIPRNDPHLIKAIETLGYENSNGSHCDLKIVEIPDDVNWVIEEYDGLEWIAEKHRTWR
jgi:hypothetical protein